MNGVFNIYVVLHQDAAIKTRMYLRDHYESDPRSSIYIVVIQDEETESANALKLMMLLQRDQEQHLVNMPDYELEVYRKAGTKTQMDILNFNKEQTLVLEGHCIPDVPLSGCLS